MSRQRSADLLPLHHCRPSRPLWHRRRHQRRCLHHCRRQNRYRRQNRCRRNRLLLLTKTIKKFR